MKALAFIGLLLVGIIFPSSIMAHEVWIFVQRRSGNTVSYKVNERELLNLDDVASYLTDKRKQLSSFPPVRAVFDPNCTFDDFSNLRGWLGKIGVLDSKYYLTDAGHRAISEVRMIGGQLPYPTSTDAARSNKPQPSEHPKGSVP